MKKVLITAFEPFSIFKNNPTIDVLEFIPNLNEVDLSYIEYKKIILPVHYQKASEILEKQIALFQPDEIILMGLNSSVDKIQLENRARNINDSNVLDNLGNQIKNKPIIPNHDEFLYTEHAVIDIMSYLLENGMEAGISNNCGTFVCNDLYYRTLINHKNALFIHIPNVTTKEDVLSVARSITMISFYIT